VTGNDLQDLIEIGGNSEGLTKRGQCRQVPVEQPIVNGERRDLHGRNAMIEISASKSFAGFLVVDLEERDHVFFAIDDRDCKAGFYANRSRTPGSIAASCAASFVR